MPGQIAGQYDGNQMVLTSWGAGTVLAAAVNVASSGNNTAIAAVAGKFIVPLQGDMVASGAVTVTVQSSGGTVLDGPMAFAANGGKVYPNSPYGHYATGRGEGLVINLGGAVQVGGHLIYALVG